MLVKCLLGEGVLIKILLMLTRGGASKNVGGGGVVNEKIPNYVEKWRSLQNIYLLFFKSVVCLIFSSKKICLIYLSMSPVIIYYIIALEGGG